MSIFSDLLEARGHLILDGAMGTQLFDAGLTAGDAPELWNLDHPEKVSDIHRSYVTAGSDIVLTNTFGGNRHRLKLHNLQERVAEINAAGVRCARVAADNSDRTVLVAGSMGPTGELIAPLGALSEADTEAAFAEQAEALEAGGADLIWIETLSDLPAVEAALRGARRATGLPVVATLSFDTAGRTMMGLTGTEAGQRLAELGIDGVGANCGANLADTEAAVADIRAAAGETPVASKANAGIPVWKGSELSYDGTPEVLAAHACRARDAGANLIGACCGSTPAHISMMADVLAGRIPVPDIGPPEGTRVDDAAIDPDHHRSGRRSGRRRRA
ncbi:MAG: betaine--homocysteine S-methyltransferase [Acidimicrobiia bacterium]|nr:betaine--homocysteine S-methyltransferase [Actinomycetota bacterium]MBL6924884.1 betaine--homocysteine S-methyltransferase [Acidimicrobiia bacterium]